MILSLTLKKWVYITYNITLKESSMIVGEKNNNMFKRPIFAITMFYLNLYNQPSYIDDIYIMRLILAGGFNLGRPLY